jgi:transposase
MELQLTELLNIPGLVVEYYRNLGQELILDVEAETDYSNCPKCGQVSNHLHQNHGHLVRDLPLSNRQVFLRVNRRQFKCKKCGKPFSEDLDFVGKGKKYTHRYATNIVEKLVHSDLTNVAKNNHLTEREVEAMINHVAQQIFPINLSGLKRLGIDEISLVKGQGKFLVVLVDLDTGKLVGLVKEKKQKAIESVLLSWGIEVLEQIEEVSMDLAKIYKSIAEKLCPNAVITVDRFHVSKLLHEELNQGRIEQKKTAESLKAESREKVLGNLKGCKYILLKRSENLNEKQKNQLIKLKEASPKIAIMYNLKEEFTEIFDKSNNLGEGTINLLDWLEKAAPFFQKTVKTIKNWFGEVVGYFERKTTQGVVEGINNKLKLIKRSGFGFRNFDNFQKRSLLVWHLTNK